MFRFRRDDRFTCRPCRTSGPAAAMPSASASRAARRRGARLLRAGIGALAITALGVGGAVAADEFPKRKAGLWQMKSSGGPMGGAAMEQCIDAATDNLLRNRSREGENCDPPKMTRSGDTYQVETQCRREGGTTAMRGEYRMQGDTRYTGSMRMRFEPPISGASEMNMTMEGHWIGPCRAGMKPGDVVIAGVPRTNLLNREGPAPSQLSPEEVRRLREEMRRNMRKDGEK